MGDSLKECNFYIDERSTDYFLISPIYIGLLYSNESNDRIDNTAVILKWFKEYLRMNKYFESRLVV